MFGRLLTLSLAAVLALFSLRNSGVPPQTSANRAYGSLMSDQADEAVRLFRRALADDPAFPYRWSDLADALAERGSSIGEVMYCFERASQLAPASPQIQLRTANYYFASGHIAPALRASRRVLELTPEYDDLVFSSWQRLTGKVDLVLDEAAGTNIRAARSFFRFALSSKQNRLIEPAWNLLARRGYISSGEGAAMADWLLARNQDRNAWAVWTAYVAPGPTFADRFEQPDLNGGFAPRILTAPGALAKLDTSAAHSGRGSLRIVLDGSTNLDLVVMRQHVWLEPGRYRLSGWMKTAAVSSDEGFRLSLLGVSTRALTGNNDWTQVAADIAVASPGAPGELELIRKHSWRFDGKFGGVVWLDDIELRPERPN